MLVHMSLASWEVTNHVVICHYTITVCTNAWAHDLHSLVLTVELCWASGTLMVSKHTVY